MPNQPTYVPINCWNCKTQNNAALSKTCRSCGRYLRSGEDILKKDRYWDGIAIHPAFRGFIWSGLAVVLVCAGLIYFYGKEGPPPEMGVVEEVPLPADSWYNKSLWSYVSKYPSIRQIVNKNNEVNGKLPSPEIARTFSISGKMSHARGACFASLCMEKWERPKTTRITSPKGEIIEHQNLPPVKRLGPETRAEPVTYDQYEDLSFSEFGEIEVETKIPDKIVKRAHAKVLSGGPYRTVEILEVFNGVAGRKTANFFDETGIKVKSENEVMDQQKIEIARAELASLWGSNFEAHTEMRLRGIEKVNDRVAFAIASKNRRGMPETHFFDAVTGFVIKVNTTELSTFIDDYRPYRQGMMPYTIYYRRPETGGYHSWIKFEVSEWKLGDYVDDSIFEIPAD